MRRLLLTLTFALCLSAAMCPFAMASGLIPSQVGAVFLGLGMIVFGFGVTLWSLMSCAVRGRRYTTQAPKHSHAALALHIGLLALAVLLCFLLFSRYAQESYVARGWNWHVMGPWLAFLGGLTALLGTFPLFLPWAKSAKIPPPNLILPSWLEKLVLDTYRIVPAED